MLYTFLLRNGYDRTLKLFSNIVKDEGIGILKKNYVIYLIHSLYDSKTRTKSGDILNGQIDIGLTFYKKVIKVHGGMICAERDGIEGS